MARKGATDKISQTTTDPAEKDFQGSAVEGQKILVTPAGGKVRRQIWENGRLVGEE